MENKKISYKDAGVDIEAGTEVIRNIKDDIKTTFNEYVLTEIGSFGGLFQIPKMDNPVLVSSIDGVGTKLIVARMAEKYDTVGQDLVNHCVNDILVQGAFPLFFLDYVGIGKLDKVTFSEILKGFIKACKENGCVLIGGETAEMPGIYSEKDFDLVGTIVGIVEKNKIINGQNIKEGDLVFGLPSSGLHTNGYSLARKILFEISNYKIDSYIDELGETLGEQLLKIHKSYLEPIKKIINKIEIKGLAHITGGGFIDNIPRILPDNVDVEINKGSWEILPIFNLLYKLGNLDDNEAYKVFNMGIGMVIITSPDSEDIIMDILKEDKVKKIGVVKKGNKKVNII